MPPLILVVDDEPKIVRLARDYLEKNGFRVVTAADGQSALTTPRREKPDLVILDLMLPNIDGVKHFNKEQQTKVLDVAELVVQSNNL